MIVYVIKNTLNDKVYVGQTTRPIKDRWKQHVRCSKKHNYPISRAILKHGKENFTIEEIDGANSLSELNYLETHYIYKFNSLAKESGYNVLLGGNNKRMPKSVKEKISKSLKGVSKISNISKELKSKIAKENGSKTFNNFENWALANGSKWFEVYKAIKTKDKKYTRGKFIGKWLTSINCSKDLGITSSHIRNCLLNNRKQHKGYIFTYTKEK